MENNTIRCCHQLYRKKYSRGLILTSTQWTLASTRLERLILTTLFQITTVHVVTQISITFNWDNPQISLRQKIVTNNSINVKSRWISQELLMLDLHLMNLNVLGQRTLLKQKNTIFNCRIWNSSFHQVKLLRNYFIHLLIPILMWLELNLDGRIVNN